MTPESQRLTPIRLKTGRPQSEPNAPRRDWPHISPLRLATPARPHTKGALEALIAPRSLEMARYPATNGPSALNATRLRPGPPALPAGGVWMPSASTAGERHSRSHLRFVKAALDRNSPAKVPVPTAF